MILSNLISNELMTTVSLANPDDRVPVGLGAPDANQCRAQIERIVREIECSEVRDVLDTVFKDLLRLLECLSLIESHLRQVNAAEETFALFEKFRDESLECLMYSDWPQFESFCERLKIASGSLPELEPVFHQFRCYLETLLGQVRMRAVLANDFPVQFGANNSFSSPTSKSSNSEDDADSAWDEFAVAV